MYQESVDYIKLIRGRYEVERLPKDFSPECIVPDFAYNILNTKGLLYQPVADKNFLENGGKKPAWPDGKKFAICLTHDVDEVSCHSWEESLRMRRSRILGRSSTARKVKDIVGLGLDWHRYKGRKNPIHCYEQWLKAEAEVNARSTFFFWPGIKNVVKRHRTDCLYDLNDTLIFDKQKCSVAEMIQEIERRGWEIGLHPSWYSFNDVSELKRQKEQLEKVIGHEVASVRQHYLHYDIRITPRIHYEAGFKFDSTIGFNDNIGFRFGTCYPWNLYDLKAEKELPVLEIPLIIQDGALLNLIKGMRLDEDMAFQYVIQLTEEVEGVGGVLTLLWHPNHINKPDWWSLYLRTLNYLKQKQAWFASVKEIGDWWQLNNGEYFQ